MSKRLFISTLTTLLISATAEGFAADMAVKAPPVVAPPPPAWTGFYFGGNVGYGWRQKEFIDNFSPPIGAEDGSVTANGVVGGVQGGYNYQIDAILLGIEGGFTWSGANGTFSCFPLLAPQTCTANPQWLADVAGRLGVVWNSPVFGNLLFYGKGGAAWVRDNYTDLALSGAPGPALPGVLFSASETRSGWVAGAGIELMILPAISVRAEYDYYGFPDKSVGFNGGPGNFFTEDIKQNMQTFTVGVNYHFGYVAPVAAPVVTK
ncbi:MAG: outer membrane beta-barrel protein [Xanthobacteraceae bacterium]